MKSLFVAMCASALALASCAHSPTPTAPVQAKADHAPSNQPDPTNGAAAIPALGRTSIADLERMVSAGDVKAEVELGARYGQGKGVTQDYGKAADLLRAAAKHNDPDADYLLGVLEYNGLGMPKNEAASVELFERAADQHHPLANYWMGFMIANGRGGISPSWAGALPYLWAAATNDSAKNSKADFLLGYAYDHGNNVDRNVKAAAYWYRRAMSVDMNVKAQYCLLLLIKNGEVAWQPGDPGADAYGKDASPAKAAAPKL